MVIGQRCHTTFATSLCAVILPQLNWYLIQFFLLWTYSLPLLQENGHDEISIKAMGRAINKTVMVVELIKVSGSSLVCLIMLLLEFLLMSRFFYLALDCSSREGLEVFIRTLLLNLLISQTHGNLWKKAFSRKDILIFLQTEGDWNTNTLFYTD